MNKRIIIYVLSKISYITALFLLFPIITGLIYHESTVTAYIITFVIAIALGFILGRVKLKSNVFYLREGCFITVLSWLMLSLICSIPFIITGEVNHSLIDSLFESISGLTTTGSTTLPAVEVLSQCTNLWRCELHWIGGLGVLVFLLALIPISSGSSINIFKSESSSDKLVPKIKSSTRILYTVYGSLTIIDLIFLLLGRIPFYDALCIAFSTAGTGGFGIKNDSLAGYPPYIQWVTAIFMLAFTINLSNYYYLVMKSIKKIFSQDELKVFITLVFSYTVFIIIDVTRNIGYYPGAIRDIFFTVSSIVSTSGFSTVDYNLWPSLSQFIILVMIVIGGCSGSTAGGFKVFRVVILQKVLKREVNYYIHPKKVTVLNMNHAPLSDDTIHSTMAFFIVYTVMFIISIFLVSISEADFLSNFSAVAASINNVGPGLSLPGPTGNYGYNTDFSKIVLMFDMIAGRLGLFPVLIFFHLSNWKDIITK